MIVLRKCKTFTLLKTGEGVAGLVSYAKKLATTPMKKLEGSALLMNSKKSVTPAEIYKHLKKVNNQNAIASAAENVAKRAAAKANPGKAAFNSGFSKGFKKGMERCG